MKYVKIVNGIYGYKPEGSKHVEPKRPSDPAFLLDDREAERLVASKIAEYAGETPDTVIEAAPKSGGNAEFPQYSVEMTVEKLREIMAQCGLGFKVGMSKVNMVEALDEYFAKGGAEDTNGEEPPDLTPEEPVT